MFDLENQTVRKRLAIQILHGKTLFQINFARGVVLNDHSCERFVYFHNRNQAAYLRATIHNLDGFPFQESIICRADLHIEEIILKCSLRILYSRNPQICAVHISQIVEIRAIRQSVLSYGKKWASLRM